MKPISALWRFALVSVLSVLLLVIIANAIRQPVQAPTSTYHAAFTDVSGLADGADVRVRGVRVGKVDSIDLQRNDDGSSVAELTFTLDNRFTIVPGTRLAVKYQALTGLRYVDVQNPAEGDLLGATKVTDVPTEMTQPSFDITVLFNGLQPVLAALSPEEINTFTDNTVAFLQGDDGGLEPMLESIHKLTRFVANRQDVVATLVHNLNTLADGVKGRSEYLAQMLDEIELPINQAVSMADEFRKSQIAGQDFNDTVIRLLAALGLRPGMEPSRALDQALTNTYDAIEAFKRTPVIWENIPPPPENGGPVPCSKGRPQLPEAVDVLLNGQRIVLCKK
ncbi:MlaD family protein [Mycolicibacter sinensis]|uniref:Mammalian cell entry protein n=1 Tax=Mycolicibacter sinensis (strain JDM601) TaxID=875328 RepID=A0A1A2EBM2_MYCSD|nr:MlaD family protein [Mycolicibacter sinensis]OBG02562.1 mammalian cell entry protein [Mycolicibacter sinensis]OBG03068.1 mammalian cell entry protein [Mycolicibacter sinensis]